MSHARWEDLKKELGLESPSSENVAMWAYLVYVNDVLYGLYASKEAAEAEVRGFAEDIGEEDELPRMKIQERAVWK